MGDRQDPRPETIAARAAGQGCGATGGILPPIQPSTSFARTEAYEKIDERAYSRDDNPGFEAVEAVLCQLEGGAAAAVFASGMAATATVFQALAPGDHVVVADNCYFGVGKWLRAWAEPWGLRVSVVDTTDLAAVERALEPGRTRLVHIETPGNPSWNVTDIAAVAALTHGAGARLMVDNTVATPVLTRPLALGADLVVHSATKYLNGHSDVIAGAVVAAKADDLWERIKSLRYLQGPILGPFEAWLLLRGMRTLFLRVRHASRSAQTIAETLVGDPRVAEVCYPGLVGFPGHAIARRQMQGGFGGVLSIRLAGGAAAALETARRAQVFLRATSLGGVESLIEHRHTIEGADGVAPPDLVRLSIGAEAVADLLADLDQAMGRAPARAAGAGPAPAGLAAVRSGD